MATVEDNNLMETIIRAVAIDLNRETNLQVDLEGMMTEQFSLEIQDLTLKNRIFQTYLIKKD